MDLYPYQREGVDWLKQAPHRLLADQPGTGKTVQALVAAKELGVQSMLVICPAVAREHWNDHIKRIHDCLHGVVSYDEISRADNAVRRWTADWDLLILDEAHYLKNKKANRTKRIYGANKIAHKAKRVWALSGTPSPNHAGELWTHLRALWPELITTKKHGKPMSLFEFENFFCQVRETPFGRQIVGSKNIPILRDRMKPIILRRRKEDVLPDLPPLRFVPEMIGAEDGSPEFMSTVGMPADPHEALTWLKVNATNFAVERRLLANYKAGFAHQWLDNELRGNWRKLIVFGWHTEPLRKLHSTLAEFKPVIIDGAVSDAQRNQNIDSFQNDPECRLFIGQIKACGVAITLTAASDVLFIEQDWTPDNNYQAACRAHRIGQKDGVLARCLTMRGSLDEKIQRVLIRKQNELAQIYD